MKKNTKNTNKLIGIAMIAASVIGLATCGEKRKETKFQKLMKSVGIDPKDKNWIRF